jgi:hypothetical protein
MSRSRLEIPLELDRSLIILEAKVQDNSPRAILGRMRGPTGIMGSKPFIEIGGDADVALFWDRETLEKIDALHEAVPLRTSLRQCFGGQPSP